MISLRGGMLDDNVIYHFLRLLCDQVKDFKCSTVDPLHLTEYFNCSCDIANIHRHIHICSDLCDSDYVTIPLNRDLHWSLITADFTKYPIVTLFHVAPFMATIIRKPLTYLLHSNTSLLSIGNGDSFTTTSLLAHALKPGILLLFQTPT